MIRRMFPFGRSNGDAHRPAAAGQRVWPLLSLFGHRKSSSAPPPADGRAIRRRTAFIAIGLAAWAAVIEARLVTLQVFDRTDLVARAARQQTRTPRLPARRGDIVDRKGR